MICFACRYKVITAAVAGVSGWTDFTANNGIGFLSSSLNFPGSAADGVTYATLKLSFSVSQVLQVGEAVTLNLPVFSSTATTLTLNGDEGSLFSGTWDDTTKKLVLTPLVVIQAVVNDITIGSSNSFLLPYPAGVVVDDTSYTLSLESSISSGPTSLIGPVTTQHVRVTEGIGAFVQSSVSFENPKAGEVSAIQILFELSGIVRHLDKVYLKLPTVENSEDLTTPLHLVHAPTQSISVLYTAANWDLIWYGVTTSITGPAGTTGVATGVDESAAIKTALESYDNEVQTLTIADCGAGKTFTIGFTNAHGVKQSTAALVCDAAGTLADSTAVQNALTALSNWPTAANYPVERAGQPDATVSVSITAASPLTMEITIANGGTGVISGDIPMMAAECTGTVEVQTLSIADCGAGNTFTIGFTNVHGVRQSTAALVCDAAGTLADSTAAQNALTALSNWPTQANYPVDRAGQPDATVSVTITSASPLTMEITIDNGGTSTRSGDIPMMDVECTGAGASTCAPATAVTAAETEKGHFYDASTCRSSTAVTATEKKKGFFTVSSTVSLVEDASVDSHVYVARGAKRARRKPRDTPPSPPR
jgi:hypothetical protein